MIVFSVLELTAKSPEALFLYSRLTYTCIVPFPIAWVYLCARTTLGPPPKHPHPLLYVTLLIPFTTILTVWVPSMQFLLWVEHRVLFKNGGLFHIVDSYGPWFWVHTAYSYSLFLYGLALTYRDFFAMNRIRKAECLLNVLAVSIPVAANISYVFRLIPGIERDFSSLLYSLSGVLLMIEQIIARANEPIDYSAIFNRIEQAAILLDGNGQILLVNERAAKRLRIPQDEKGFVTSVLPMNFRKIANEVSRNGFAEFRVDGFDDKALSVTMFALSVNGSPHDGYSVLLRDTEDSPPVERISRREAAVYDLLLTELTVKEIAVQLGISENTAKTHIRHIYEKLLVGGRAELVAKNRSFLREKRKLIPLNSDKALVP